MHKCPHCDQVYYYIENVGVHIKMRHKQEEKMDDQMEQVWRCKDGMGGFFTGSKLEVEAYLKSKNPLAGMRFPYRNYDLEVFGGDAAGAFTRGRELSAVVAFANLAPLIQEWRETANRYGNGSWGEQAIAEKFWEAYEEALKQVPQ